MSGMLAVTRAKEMIRWRPAALDVLRLEEFRYFWLANAGADLGVELRFLAASWLVLDLTDSALWVGLVGGIRAVPIVVLGLLGGAATDRLDRRTILLVTRSVMAMLGFLTGYLITSGRIEPWHLLLISMSAGTTLAFSGPAWRTMLVDLVGRDRALTANSIVMGVADVGSIVGPAVGGYVIASFGVEWVYYVSGAVFFGSVALMYRVQGQTGLRLLPLDRSSRISRRDSHTRAGRRRCPRCS